MMITHNVVVGCKSQTLQITPGALSKRSCRQSYCDVGRVKYSFTLTSKKIWGSHRLTKLHPNGLSPTSAISRDKGPGGWLPLFFQLTEMCADCAAEHLLLAAQRRWSRSGTQAQRDTVRADLTDANPLHRFPERTVISSRLKCTGEVTKTKTWQRMWMHTYVVNSLSWRGPLCGTTSWKD